jgi:hypothetical protein
VPLTSKKSNDYLKERAPILEKRATVSEIDPLAAIKIQSHRLGLPFKSRLGMVIFKYCVFEQVYLIREHEYSQKNHLTK